MNFWWAKLGAKLLLSRIGLPYRAWKVLGVFVHGRMDDPAWCLEGFRTQLAIAGYPTEGRVFAGEKRTADEPFVVLELGPGDSLYNGVIACAFGADRCLLVDHGDFAKREVNGFRRIAKLLAAQGFEVRDLERVASVDEALSLCNIGYFTEGIASLRQIPSESVDFIFSNAVLEHIRKREFRGLLAELRRILKPRGRSAHRIDLQDHLGGALNNLRFSETVWESPFMAESGFYTNRIRYREMLSLFDEAGFTAEVKRELRWSCLPTPRSKLSLEYRAIPDEDLLVYGFDVALNPR